MPQGSRNVHDQTFAGDSPRATPFRRPGVEQRRRHTDADGDDAHNLDLSKRRAAAVKAFLVATYGIKAGRLETEGYGETRPAAPNTSPEGRQQNRRVELVRRER